jgi:hypothetical protein
MEMNEPVVMNDDEKPLDPEVAKIKTKLTRLLFTSVGTMILGIMALIAVIVYKITRPAVVKSLPSVALPHSVDEISAIINVPVGAKVNATSFSNQRILFDLTLKDETRVMMLFDVEQGKTIAFYKLTGMN